ncbi:hypothetical protein J4403_04035 [Candidatus Woesearchaeota archaeon]|nr:hypothetical protein [Candidatus Woesearchaeota archaeon]
MYQGKKLFKDEHKKIEKEVHMLKLSDPLTINLKKRARTPEEKKVVLAAIQAVEVFRENGRDMSIHMGRDGEGNEQIIKIRSSEPLDKALHSAVTCALTNHRKKF